MTNTTLMSSRRFATGLNMGSSLQLALDPVYDTQAIFRVVLDAISWPGSPRQLPVAAKGAPGNPWAAGLLITLVDHETTLSVIQHESLETFIHQRTNVASAPAAEADFILAELENVDPNLPAQLKRGSLEYPDDGATLVLWTANASVNRQTLRLAGPGVPDGLQVAIPALPSGLLASREEAIYAYPAGIDMLLIDAAGVLIALPRTTQILTDGEEG